MRRKRRNRRCGRDLFQQMGKAENNHRNLSEDRILFLAGDDARLFQGTCTGSGVEHFRKKEILVDTHRILQQPVYENHIRADDLGSAAHLVLPHFTVMAHELQRHAGNEIAGPAAAICVALQ